MSEGPNPLVQLFFEVAQVDHAPGNEGKASAPQFSSLKIWAIHGLDTHGVRLGSIRQGFFRWAVMWRYFQRVLPGLQLAN